jgi:uncharacterized membrane protein YkoI
MSDTARLKPIHVMAMLAAAAVVAAMATGGLMYKAEAQEEGDDSGNEPENATWSVAAEHPLRMGMMMHGGFSPLDLDGSVNITEQVADQIMSSVEVPFSEAATTAADSVDNGTVLNGNLGVIGGFLVYSFTVVDDDNRIYSVIVDAGNGEVLHTSEPMDSTPEGVVGSIMGGPMGIHHSFGFAKPGVMAYKVIDKAEIEEDGDEE